MTETRHKGISEGITESKATQQRIDFPTDAYEKLEPSGEWFEDESAPELINFEEETELTWATEDLERAIGAAIYNVPIGGQKQVHVYAVNPKNYKEEEDGYASAMSEPIIGHLIIQRKGGFVIEFNHLFSWDCFEIINPDELNRLENIPHLFHGTSVLLKRM